MTHASALPKPTISDAIPPDALLPTGVCMLTGELPPDRGGVGDYTARLSDALAVLGVPVGVLTRSREGVPSRRVLGESRVPVRGTVEAWDARVWPLVAQTLRRLGPRPLLHIQFQAGAFDLGGSIHLLPSLVRAVVPQARVVTTFHDFLIPYLFPKAGPARLAANRLLARTSHAAIFTDLADLETAGPGVRGHVVPIGSNIDCEPGPGYRRDAARRRFGADELTFLVGYFGFLNPSKGVPTLLEAVERVAAGLNGASFDGADGTGVDTGADGTEAEQRGVTGGAQDRRTVRLALIGAEAGASNVATDLTQAGAVRAATARPDIAASVVRTGFVAPPELSAALLACDVIALPFLDGASARRGTLMAAIAHGRPIVSTLPARRSGMAGPATVWLGGGPGAAALRDGESILLVPPDDADALASALSRLALDAELRARLGEGARAVAARIAWPTLAAETARIYASTFR